MTKRRRVLLIDNSIATTGAFHSAIVIGLAVRSFAQIIYVLPGMTALHSVLRERGFSSTSLPMVEIGRSWSRLLTYFPMLLLNGLRLRRLLARERIDVLIANDYYNLLPAVVRLLGWRGQTITFVRLLPWSQNAILNRAWVSAMRYSSDRILAVSNVVKAQLPLGLRAEVFYCPSGRDLEATPYLAPPMDREQGSATFLYLANYIVGKGQQHALEAFPAVLKANPAARLRFVGGDMGLKRNANYRTRLQERAGILGVDHAVSFQGPTKEVAPEFQKADVVLNFSESESFSQTCLEAGLVGRPVIATRCGGPEEIIRDGVTGLLVGRQDIAAMEAAMIRLAEDPHARSAMGSAAYAWTRERFGATDFSDRMRQLLGILDES